jgi:hypothetical protein
MRVGRQGFSGAFWEDQMTAVCYLGPGIPRIHHYSVFDVTAPSATSRRRSAQAAYGWGDFAPLKGPNPNDARSKLIETVEIDL